MHALETRTAPPKEEAAAAVDAGFGAPLMGLGNEPLMITNAPAYGAYGYHTAGGIPDPYAQAAMSGYGAPNMGGMNMGGAYGGGYY